MKNISRLILCIVAVGAIATSTIIINRPLSKPKELAPERIRLNEILTNDSSQFEELEGLDRKVRAYMRKWEMKGASLAITRNDSLLYAKGYGWADEGLEIEMQPSHIMRIASVSKLILNDPFFNDIIKDRNHHKITVEHLLRHQGGFHRDPLFSSRDVMHQLRLEQPPVKEDFYRLILSRKLSFAPGSWQKYSNFGYLLLSEIIEKVSGMPYEDFIRQEVLAPAGCYDMHIGGNYYADKRDNEVRYYAHRGDGQYIEDYSDNGEMVERCYGGNNIPLLSGAGAWCASPAEIARLVAAIDGRPEVPDIISQEAFEQMTEYIDKDTFSLGWNDTAPEKGWNRTGTLSGTCALVRQYPDGECWILITNTSTYRGPNQSRYTEALFKQCREEYSSKLPERNMFVK